MRILCAIPSDSADPTRTSKPLPTFYASAYMRSGASDNLLTDAAKRYRVDVEKLEKAVVAEFAAKRSKAAKPKTKPRTKSVI